MAPLDGRAESIQAPTSLSSAALVIRRRRRRLSRSCNFAEITTPAGLPDRPPVALLATFRNQRQQQLSDSDFTLVVVVVITLSVGRQPEQRFVCVRTCCPALILINCRRLRSPAYDSQRVRER